MGRCTLLKRLLPLLGAAPPIELMTRCVLFLLKVHHKAIVANAGLVSLLHPLDAALKARLASEQKVVGYVEIAAHIESRRLLLSTAGTLLGRYNLAAMRLMQSGIEATTKSRFFEEASASKSKKKSVMELRMQTAATKRTARDKIAMIQNKPKDPVAAVKEGKVRI